MSKHPVDSAGLMLPDASWPPGKEAPGALELLRRFCNSSNPENGAERFRDPDQFDAWLVGEGLAPRPGRPWRAPAGDPVPWPTPRAGRRQPRRARRPGRLRSSRGRRRQWIVATRRGRAGASRSTERGRGASPLLAHLASIIVIAQADGSWSRLKACTNDHCQWMFYDHSKNANGAWCSMTACGQRHKAREYRARRASHDESRQR